jgi:hypothetical protein
VSTLRAVVEAVTAGILAGAALLLVVGGATKVVDPSGLVGALAALGWPSSATLVRVGAVAETCLGAATLVVGGRPLALLVAVSYMGFALFVMAALQAGTPLATCGCIGGVDTPPSPEHVVVDGLLAGGAVLAAAMDAPALVEASWPAWPVALVVALAGYGLLTRRQPGAPP